MTKFFMMVGIPASGKSYYAKQLSEEYNAIIYSSDAYRAKFGAGEEDQSINNKVFYHLHNDIKNSLRNGENCIYDATNLISKRRRAFLQELNNISCEKICVLVIRPFEICLVSNHNRERTVPEYAMVHMYKSFETPYIEEGWDDIYLKLNEDYRTYNITAYLTYATTFNQDNFHHSCTLGDHTKNVVNYLDTNNIYDSNLITAAYLHDYGKIYCKTFKNTHGDITDVAHYYNHENVGAYEVFFFKSVKNPLYVSWLVNNHMRPYSWKNPEVEDKYRKLWGENKFNAIMLLHKADSAGH